MINVLFALTMTGSAIVLLWRSLYPLLKNRFSSVWHYAVLKTALLLMMLPVAFILSNAGFIRQAAAELKASVQSAAVYAGGEDAQLSAFTDIAASSAAGDAAQRGNTKQPSDLNRLILLIWAAGVLLSIGCKTCRYNGFRRQVLRWSTPYRVLNILEILENCKKETGVKSAVTLMINPLIHTPMVTGVFHPRIILPEKHLSTDEARCIFLHELTHIRRIPKRRWSTWSN